ncbi:hypothetical protein BYT27DRAFT_7190354 [Phlegmacium glaucopus]|nr:hypothetical protein BYT27DRAFT_7190354 [Phlegmacium glaucopus]
MGRWTQYDEDDYRLPEGMKRIGYDSDTRRYYFRDQDGSVWQGPEYGEMTRVKAYASPRTQSTSRGYRPLSTDPVSTTTTSRWWPRTGPRAMVGEACSREGTFRLDRGNVFLSGLRLASSKFQNFVRISVPSIFFAKVCRRRGRDAGNEKPMSEMNPEADPCHVIKTATPNSSRKRIKRVKLVQENINQG